MSVEFVVDAELRNDAGKGASRRLRHAGKIPAIIYGRDKAPQSLALGHHAMFHHTENEAFFSHILVINIDGQSEKAILKDMQWHPSKQQIMHMDFQRVDENHAIRVHVPLHFMGEDVAPGIKEGGLASHLMTSVEVSCLPAKLPEFIEVDISALDLGASIHLSELTLPEGVELIELSHGIEHDLPVVSVQKTRGGIADETEESAEEDGAEEEKSAE